MLRSDPIGCLRLSLFQIRESQPVTVHGKSVASVALFSGNPELWQTGPYPGASSTHACILGWRKNRARWIDCVP